MSADVHIPFLTQQLGANLEEVAVQGDRPLLLDDPAFAYLTLCDQHQLFSVRMQKGTLHGRREHLTRCRPGQLLMGIEPAAGDSAISLLVSGVPGNRIARFPSAALQALLEHPEHRTRVSELFESWIELLIATLPHAPLPTPHRIVSAHEAVVAGGAHLSRGATGRFAWATAQDPQCYLGIAVDPARDSVRFWPLAEEAWLLAADRDAPPRTTTEILAEHGLRVADAFCGFVMRVADRGHVALLAQRAARSAASRALERARLDDSIARLANHDGTAAPHREVGSADAYELACRRIFAWLELPPLLHLVEPRSWSTTDVQTALGHMTGVRARGVLIEQPWAGDDAGPLLAFFSEAGERRHPVALLPRDRGYTLYDPRDQSLRELDAHTSTQLHPQAHQFYRTLPAEPPSLLQFLRFATAGAHRRLLRIALIGLVAGLLCTVTPLLCGQLYDRIIPGAERGLLFQVVVMLLCVHAGSFLFDAARGLAIVGVQARLDATLQAAFWDRMLNLPVSFFRERSVGDIAARAAGVGTMRDALSDVALASILAGIFSIWNIAVLFYFDMPLALTAVALLSVAAGVTMLAAYAELQQQRRIAEVDGLLHGLLVQLFTGMGKLRVAASEQRAFAGWARLFGPRRDATLRRDRVGARLAAFQAAFPLLCSLALWWLVTRRGASSLTTGEFLAFNASFSLFLSAVLELSRAASTALRIVPLYERARPILASPLETAPSGTTRVELTGALQLRDVSFRYPSATHPVLQDISLRIEPGEFVAVVGASGSGKSTLLRLLLGFETPQQGGVYYDGHPLTSLDVREVRGQIGVVLQHSRVMPGDIYSNIVGSTGLGLDEALQAARLAALDKDLEAMPMGIYTVIAAAGGGALSGGQRQRLLLARALARKPKILLLDEATSALDNQTQAVVRDSLDALRVTRVVIAHRLSTIRSADKIIVLDGGRIVQVGSFQTLLEKGGVFSDLARRQLA